jgi:hypothetical protein
MFIIIATYAKIGSVKFILKLLRHVLVLIHTPSSESLQFVSANVMNY